MKVTNFVLSGYGHWFLPFLVLFLRYLFFAGTFYLVFYAWKRKTWLHLKIQPKFPSHKIIKGEVLYSISTILIFGIMAIGIVWGKDLGIFKLRTEPFFPDFQLLALQLISLILVHDTWFYWTHRLMHHRLFFRYVHAVHHRSHNPTPWAAFSFHPAEAVIEAAFFPLVLLVVPFHLGVFFLFMLYMIFFNVLGHLGFEILPVWFLKSRFGKWQNTSTHHNMHHQCGRFNYGLYFNFWDRIMRTNHPEYTSRLESVLKRKTKTPQYPVGVVDTGKGLIEN